jgi:Flp pilus assembly protein TadG
MVEFALVLPIFLLVVFMIVDFGMGFHAWITVSNASREGARIGVVGADAATIEARVRDTASSLADDDDLTVTVTNAVDQGGDPGESLTVQVEYDYDLITPLSGILGFVSGGSFGPDIHFQSTSSMRLE